MTRNTKDFEDIDGLVVVNTWQLYRPTAVLPKQAKTLRALAQHHMP